MTDEINAYWHPDGSGIDAVFAERDALRVEVERLTKERDSFRSVLEGAGYGAIDSIAANTTGQSLALGEAVMHLTMATVNRAASYLTALQQIAAAGPMTTDDWRWKVARDAIKSAHVNETPKPEHDREDVLTGATPVSDADVEQTVEGYPV